MATLIRVLCAADLNGVSSPRFASYWDPFVAAEGDELLRIDGVSSPRFASYWEPFVAAEGDELLRIEGDRDQVEAEGVRLRHLALHQFLPLVKCPRELLPVIHDLPDALVILATKPKRRSAP